jgi:hypothetical protein
MGISVFILYLSPALASFVGILLGHFCDRERKNKTFPRLTARIFAIFAGTMIANYLFIGVCVFFEQGSASAMLVYWQRIFPNTLALLALGIPLSLALAVFSFQLEIRWLGRSST